MQSSKVIDISVARVPRTVQQQKQFDSFTDLPDVPVLSETLLRMELQVRERVVDLDEISSVILSDLGAAIQVIRMGGSEYGALGSTPWRIADFVSSHGLEACLDAMSKCVVTRGAHYTAILDTWFHAKETAEICRALAENLDGLLDQEDAYLVGLFHALGALPSVLGWDEWLSVPHDQALVGLGMAETWGLPSCVREYFMHSRKLKTSSRWTDLVDRAHRMLNSPWSIRSEGRSI